MASHLTAFVVIVFVYVVVVVVFVYVIVVVVFVYVIVVVVVYVPFDVVNLAHYSK